MGRLQNTKFAARRFATLSIIFLASASSTSLLSSGPAAEFAGLVGPADQVVSRYPSSPVAGTVFLCGGGKLPDRVYEEFHKLGGGSEGRLVVITTASMFAGTSREIYLLERWQSQGWKSVDVLHTRDRSVAANPAFSAALRNATAVWMVGGEQHRLLESYAGTPVHEELHNMLARGGLVGGTSAGMALAGEHAIVGGVVTPRLDAGLGFISNAIFDQHFSERRREARLASAVAAKPGIVGFGVDERTALVIHGREMRVVGEGSVHVQLGKSPRRTEQPIRLREFMRDDLVALSRAAIARADGFQPAAKPQMPRVENGSLLIVGGGRMAPSIQKKFLELAGGPEAKFVVVPTAGDARRDDDVETAWLTKAGAKNVSVVHAENRNEAESSALLEILKSADAIWFGGGRQWRFIDAYEDTACFKAFHEVLRRGGVIGGSSAGATIQGEYLVRGSPLNNTIMMAEGYERGFGFLPGTAVDQHFTQRGRAPDMQRLKRTFPTLLGLGIDEATAVVVRGSELEVVGENQVSVYKPLPDAVALAAANDSSETDGDASSTIEPEVLKPGERYDLERFARFTPPTSASAE
ncbi:MAG: cyanophycinase [Pirellulales bacterium]